MTNAVKANKDRTAEPEFAQLLEDAGELIVGGRLVRAGHKTTKTESDEPTREAVADDDSESAGEQ